MHLSSIFKGVNVGIDLGTKNFLVYIKGIGVVVNEPAVVAIDKKTRSLLAIGEDAQKMLGRTPSSIVAVRPFKGGVIADYDLAQQMIQGFMYRLRSYVGFFKPNVLVGVPWGITEVEKRAIIEAMKQSGVKNTSLIYEPLAAAIGSDLSVFEAKGMMLLDIGGGTTEVSVMSLGGICLCKSIRVAGDDFDEAIIQHCRRSYNLLVGERMAETVKIQIGSAFPLKEEKNMQISGRDLMSGLPKTFTISSYEIRDALAEGCLSIIGAVKLALEQTPPELSSDVMSSGIYLTGGGSLLAGLNKYISQDIGLDVRTVSDAMGAVAVGTGHILDANMIVKHMSIVCK